MRIPGRSLTALMLLATICHLGCSAPKDPLQAAQASALDLLERLGESHFTYVSQYRDDELGIWTLEFASGSRKAWVDISELTGRASAMHTSDKARAYKASLKEEPDFDVKAAQLRALEIAKSFDPKGKLRLDPPVLRAAAYSQGQGIAPVCRISVSMTIDGYEVEGTGASFEFARDTGDIIEFAAEFETPQLRPSPLKPISLAEAVEFADKHDRLTLTPRHITESRLAIMRVDQQPHALTWFIKFGKVSYHIDATDGTVRYRAIHKASNGRTDP